MPRERIEGRMIPKDALRPVGHVLVSERARANRMQDRAAKPSLKFVLDQHRGTVTVTLEFFLAGFGQDRLADDAGR